MNQNPHDLRTAYIELRIIASAAVLVSIARQHTDARY